MYRRCGPVEQQHLRRDRASIAHQRRHRGCSPARQRQSARPVATIVSSAAGWAKRAISTSQWRQAQAPTCRRYA
jgi:hypothetical protein